MTNQDSTQKENQQKTAALKSPYQEAHNTVMNFAMDHHIAFSASTSNDLINRVTSLIQRLSNEALERRDPWRKNQAITPEPKKEVEKYELRPDDDGASWQIVNTKDKRIVAIIKSTLATLAPRYWYWFAWPKGLCRNSQLFNSLEAAFDDFKIYIIKKETGW